MRGIPRENGEEDDGRTQTRHRSWSTLGAAWRLDTAAADTKVDEEDEQRE